MRPLLSFTLSLVAAAVVVTRGDAHAQLRIVEDPLAEPGGEFGAAVAGVGDELFVGAPGARARGHDGGGLVWMFTNDGLLERTLENPAPDDGAAFGTTLAAGEGVLHVAAPNDVSVGLAGTGAVFTFDATTGALLRVVRPPAPDATGAAVGGAALGSGAPLQSSAPLPVAAGFGLALAADAGRLVVGAPASSIDGLGAAGAVYVFDQDGALQRTLHEPSPAADARFGAAVAVINDLLFVGVPGATASGAQGAGLVRVYDPASGQELAPILSPGPAAHAAFGTTLGAVGGALFVGAPTDAAAGDGGVFVFPAEAGALPVAITPPVGGTPGFGHVAVAAGTDLLVGADLAADASGRAYLVDPATAAIRATFLPRTPRPGGRFGFALATVGTSLAIGEPAPGDGPGRVYLFGPTTGDGSNVTRTAPGLRTPSAPSLGAPSACVRAASAASVDCRLRALAQVSGGLGPRRLAATLQRARVAVRRANRMTGTRRVRTLQRAAHDVGEVARRLQTESVRTAAEALQADLASLASAP